MATNGVYYSQTSGLTISTDSRKRVIVSTGGTTTFTGNTNGSTVIQAVGTNGDLFSVDDDLTGDILVVTNATGGTIFAVNYTEPVRISGVTSGTSTNYLVIESNGVVKYREITAVGESGISGLQSVSGISGLQSVSGISGISGINGINGASGISGVSGIAGSNGVSSSVFYYSANTLSTSGNPGTGYTLWNNVTQTASTQINIHHLTDNLTNNEYTDIDVFLATIAPGQKLIIQDQQISGDYQIWNVTGATTNINPNTSTSYWTVPVSISSSAGVGSTNFANNENLFIAIQGGTSGISGLSGISGISGQLGPTGGGITWFAANTTQSMTSGNGYITTASTLTTFTLPSSITFGSTVVAYGNSTGLWQINQNAGQSIRIGNSTTTATTNALSATSQGDCVFLVCSSANTSFIAVSSIGNIYFT